ncbi:MAG: hypothetical protein HYW03_02315, partial [Deltaproteobacteria bacterium]|nr:hypothetical protein [Deltaproteobacteria bacterium]
MRTVFSVLAIASLFGWADPTLAEYVLLLKNGRRIVVQSYRDEGQMIKFYGLGGEIGIGKDHIQSIQPIGAGGEERGLSLAGPEAAPTTAQQPTAPEERVARPEVEERPLSPEDQRAREEREYQQKLSEVTAKLKEAEDRYSQSIRGTTSAEPTQLMTEEQIRARQEDAVSRFKDAQQNPSEPAPVKLLRPSPFSSLPPTTEIHPAGQTSPSLGTPQPYTERQKELSDFRKQAI